MADEDMPLCVDRALCMAAWEGHTETVRALLDDGAEVHARTDAPLWVAAMRGHADTMLQKASANGHDDTVKVLLEAGADVHAKEDWAVRWAAGNGHTDTVTVLNEWMAREAKKPAEGSETT